jgi:uncharacterized protein (TIGR00251 family)
VVDLPAGAITLNVKVTPNASRNEIMGLTDGTWRIKIAAAPDKGKANKELIEFFSKRLGIKKSSISILKGQTSHNKVVAINGITQEEIVKRFGV